MKILIKRALRDISKHRFLNIVSAVTIALSILIISTLFIFFNNINAVITVWTKGIRIIAYLNPDVSDIDLPDIKSKIAPLQGIQKIRFISKHDALSKLKEQMRRQASLFENLQENPLPDAFEIRLNPSLQTEADIESIAIQIESIRGIDSVEYGQTWLNRLTAFLNLFRLIALSMSGLFFLAIVFIVANTIRLVLYSRRDEIEIMRLVGATDQFIKTPFYIEGIIQGALGGITGLAVLFIGYQLVPANFGQGLFSSDFRVQFLPPGITLSIIAGSMLVGWLGCYFSLRQFGAR